MNNTTFCIFFREDNAKRVDNLFAIVDYYKRCNDKSNFIVYYEYVDDINARIVDHLTKNIKCKVILSNGKAEGWNKCVGYNQCAVLAHTPVLCFNDVDVIVDPEQVVRVENYLLENAKSGLIYPFDGRFLCVDNTLKNEFIDAFTKNNYKNALEHLRQFEPASQQINAKTQHVFVGHNNSPGGIVMVRKDNFIKMGGYNPNFLGWGYEDSEILSRAKILGFKCGRDLSGPCWHMDHTDSSSSKKETQAFHERNRLECAKVESMTQQQLEQYIKTWQL